MLHLLTPTGGRPEGLALLAGYINAQTYTGPVHWIIVDDCDPASSVPFMRAGIEVEIVRPSWRWAPGMITQARSILEGLANRPITALLIMEDDDAYLPSYFETMLKALQYDYLVGERVARYYNVATSRYRSIPSERHASLAATGMRGTVTTALENICLAGGDRIDLRLWEAMGHDYLGTKKLLHTENVVGIKGLPGRAGIGVGHRPDFGTPDPDGRVLAEWLGPARAAAYAEFRRG